MPPSSLAEPRNLVSSALAVPLIFLFCVWRSVSGKQWILRKEPYRHARRWCLCTPFEAKPSTNPYLPSDPRSETESHSNKMRANGKWGPDSGTVRHLLKIIPLYVFFSHAFCAAAEQVMIATPSRGLFELPVIVAMRNGYFR